MTENRGILKRFTLEEDQFITDNYLMLTSMAMGKKLNRSWGSVYGRMRKLGIILPDEVKKQRQERTNKNLEKHGAAHRFVKGHIAANKGKKMSADIYVKAAPTMFKKGNLPANTKYDGYESVRFDKRGVPRIYVRVSKAKFVEKQILNWTKINGPIPAGLILYCKDHNALNTDPSNWELVTRKESMRRCKLHDNTIAKILAASGRGTHDRDLKNKILSEHHDLIQMKRELMIAKETINDSN